MDPNVSNTDQNSDLERTMWCTNYMSSLISQGKHCLALRLEMNKDLINLRKLNPAEIERIYNKWFLRHVQEQLELVDRQIQISEYALRAFGK
jgi:hypothetical protein